MAQQTIDLGTQGGADGTGDSIRTAGVKINSNFTEVFDFAPVKSDIRFQGNKIATLSSNANIDLSASGTGKIILKDFQINDNNIETTNTNGDLRIIPNGSGRVVIDGIGFNSGTTISKIFKIIIKTSINIYFVSFKKAKEHSDIILEFLLTESVI